MRSFFSFFIASCLILMTGWYVLYQTDPSSICSHHHDKAKGKAGYLYCWPGFDFPTDTFIDGHSPIERRRKIYGKPSEK